MEKTGVLNSLGQDSLLLPVWVKAALRANDQIKLMLTILQSACSHVPDPTGSDSQPDYARELAATGLDETWLRDLPATSSCSGGRYHIPELDLFKQTLQRLLQTMARPVLTVEAKTHQATPSDTAKNAASKREATPTTLTERHDAWQQILQKLDSQYLEADQLQQLTHGRRDQGDSLHLLVMDLHKKLNKLSASLASEIIEGAHVWQIEASDRPRVMAFMAGLNRTASLKFDHPGLDTAVTRDGKRLLIQNDIGTNDAHVLVIEVSGNQISLTYSDLHPRRFAFFQALLSDFGAEWSQPQSRVTRGLNQDDAYTLGTATFTCNNTDELDQALHNLASRIVFLIDWNKARKRLKTFVSNGDAIALLTESARQNWGHRAWLEAGAEQLIYAAMQAMGDTVFRIGDRLDHVIGADNARQLLASSLQIASLGMLQGRPASIIAEEIRLQLSRLVHQHNCEFDLLMEHAAWCHALAQLVHDYLLHSQPGGAGLAAAPLLSQPKAWERRADNLVIEGRQLGQHQPRWLRFIHLLERADDIADALEETAFLLHLSQNHQIHWSSNLRGIICRLSAAVLSAAQEHVKAIVIARDLRSGSDPADTSDFLSCSWQILRLERQCDELLREAKRSLIADVINPAAMMIANDLINALEQASDHLLSCNHPLRELVFSTDNTV